MPRLPECPPASCRVPMFASPLPGKMPGARSDRLARRIRHRVIFLDEFASDRAWLAVANDAPIDFGHWHQFRAGAGQEAFVGIEHVIAREVWLADLQARRASQIHDG